MIFHLERQQVAAEGGRDAAEEVGTGLRQLRDPRPFGIGPGMQALLDEQADQHRDDHRQEGVVGVDGEGGPPGDRPHQP